MQYVETDNQEQLLSVELKAQSVQILADNAPISKNENSGGTDSVNGNQPNKKSLFAAIADRRTTTFQDEINLLLDLEMQKKKYLEWRESNLPPNYISLLLINEDGSESSINHSVPFVDVFRLKTIHENYPLRFWSCNPLTKQKEFILFEYSVPRCRFKGVVQDLNKSFTIGLNIKRESQTDYSVIVTTGVSDYVRDKVQKQLRQDFESFYGNDNSVLSLAVTCFSTFRQLLHKMISNPFEAIRVALKSLLTALWNGRYPSFILHIIGGAITLTIIFSEVVPSWKEEVSFEIVPNQSGEVTRSADNLSAPAVNTVVSNSSEPEEIAAKIKPKETKGVVKPPTRNNSNRKANEPTNTAVPANCGSQTVDPFLKNDFAAQDNPALEEKNAGTNPEGNTQPNLENLSCVGKGTF
jgi:hypothetical protein